MKLQSRVALYIRVSTEDQADSGYSIDAQIDLLQKHCLQNQKFIVDTYVDRGISGKSISGRYELQRMLKDAERNLFDEVLFFKLSRLARSNMDLQSIHKHLEKHNVSFTSITENFETKTPSGRLAFQVLGAISEFERSTIVENVKMGHKQRAKMGFHNGKLPLGYKSIPQLDISRTEATSVVIVEDEAFVVRYIFQLYANGLGLKAIANKLNHEGYKTKAQNTFSTCAVRDILDNPMYIGHIRYNQYENWSEKRRRGRSKEIILSEGKHPAIIEKDLWVTVQTLRNLKGNKSPKQLEIDFLLVGLLRCPACGSTMTSSRTVNRNKDGKKITRLYYSCSKFRSQGSSVCHANSVRKQEAEQAVIQKIQDVVTIPGLLKRIVTKINEIKVNRIKPLEKELHQTKARIQKIIVKRQRYFDLYESNNLNSSLFTSRVQELELELDRERIHQSKLEQELNTSHSKPISFETVSFLMNKLNILFENSSPSQLKTLMKLVVKKINLDDKRQVHNVELLFNNDNVNHFLSIAPSTDNLVDGAFLSLRKASSLNPPITLII